ncbi:MAG: recombination protein RecR [Proteobacteria bacterium]|nr:recombination protein RecR [Pseudomonadota bacterium]
MTDSPAPSFLPPSDATSTASANEDTSAPTNPPNNTNAKTSTDQIPDPITNPIDKLIHRLARLPGLGPRSARRLALHLISNKDQVMHPLVEDMADVANAIRLCAECGNWDTSPICRICRDPKRDSSLLCVVEHVADLWAMERAGVFGGYYHVLGGVLSAIDGVGPDALRIDQLVARLSGKPASSGGGVSEVGEGKPPSKVGEVILALSATVDGQATAHYIVDCIAHLPIKRTRLAQGVPVGGELDYLDDGTLAQALQARAVI